ncbi:MAG: DUF4326 domain-containing protein [Actinomycetota bacterium]|nr:DUF4326 domain-containing protein [Actinomycetota bacterium]
MAERIQRKRTKGWRMPDGAVYVGRPTPFGNPWTLADARSWQIPIERRQQWMVSRYRAEVLNGIWPTDITPADIEPGESFVDYVHRTLAGRDLACWCPLDVPCHSDVLLELANGGA